MTVIELIEALCALPSEWRDANVNADRCSVSRIVNEDGMLCLTDHVSIYPDIPPAT